MDRRRLIGSLFFPSDRLGCAGRVIPMRSNQIAHRRLPHALRPILSKRRICLLLTDIAIDSLGTDDLSSAATRFRPVA
jgi:hypothetical protein